ncbi:hypothetical protein OKJ99_06030, partial [Streptomyces endophyticus]|nr:hypothetical protein [Streptomyces endophyticus]
MTIGRHVSRAVVLATTAALTGATASAALAAGSETVAFSGAEHTVTVPENTCSVTIDAFGAAGGDALYGGAGGKGAEVRATVDVSAGQVLTVNVGGAGTGGTSEAPAARGGYNRSE